MKQLLAITGVLNYIFVVFLNAFTDLGHKILIQNTVFKVYDGDIQIVLTAIVNALILLPYILMFSPSGFLADKFAKNKIMEYASVFAIVITLLITYAYYQGWFFFAFAMTFLLALQSAIYGPAKYGYIKELFGVKLITSGNGAVQATTTVAILSGIIFYTVLFEGMFDESLHTKEQILQAIAPLGWLLVIGSIIEWYLARQLPNKMEEQSKRTFKLERYLKGAYLRKNIKVMRRKSEIFDSIIILSLFWSISQVVLAIFGEYAKGTLGITNTIVVQGVMALAGIGIVLGSVLAAQFSRYFINVGLSALGALGITLIVFFIPNCESIGIIAGMFMLFGIFAGLLMVPVNANIQFLSPKVHLGTILAGNNFIQNIFMFSFLILTTIFAYFGTNSIALFYMMGFVAILMTYLLLKRYFVKSFWAFWQMVFSLRHKYNYHGLENVPNDKAVLLLGNHVSWIDWIILQIPFQREINYMMDKDIYYWKGFHPIFKKGEVIPLSPKASKDAFKEAARRLEQGRMVALFPEGKITHNGELGKFYKGYELIAKEYEGMIIPFYIKGIYGSLFARYKNGNSKYFWQRRTVDVYFGKPIPAHTDAQTLESIIHEMKEKQQNA